MNVIVFASRKGGSGKSTLAAHLAAHVHKATKPCLMIDADPQGSLTLWHKLRGTNEPPIKAAVNSVSGIIAAAKRDGIEWVFIDTPPNLSAVVDDLGELEGAFKNHARLRVEVQGQLIADADLDNGQTPKIHDPTVVVLGQRRFTHHRTLRRGAPPAPVDSSPWLRGPPLTGGPDLAGDQNRSSPRVGPKTTRIWGHCQTRTTPLPEYRESVRCKNLLVRAHHSSATCPDKC